jgi:hypothetical protein
MRLMNRFGLLHTNIEMERTDMNMHLAVYS